MSRKKIPIVLLAVGIVLVLASVLWFFFSRQFGSASLTVESVPEANVYVNEELVGRTPYSGEFSAGEVTIKLIPLAFDSPRMPYEAKVNLIAGVDTVVRRNLGETNLDSSGEVISFEKSNDSSASVSVITTPDNSQVELEGKSSEHSPIRYSSIEPQNYNLTVKAEGYEEKSFSIVAVSGYTLTAIVDLAKSESTEEIKEQVEKKSEEVSKVRILSTPLGFLRVRSEASTSSEEIAQVESGAELNLIESSEDGEWHKVELIDDEEDSGWVSSEYAELI